MAQTIQRRRFQLVLVCLALLAASLAGVAQAAEPRRGGVLLAATAADAPSLDPHQEQTFATTSDEVR